MTTLQVLGNRNARVGRRVPVIGRRVRNTCLALGLLLSSAAVFADPLRIVSGGFGSGGDDTGLWVVGLNWSLATGALPSGTGPVVTCNPCTPGQTLDLSSSVTISNWGPGYAQLDDGRSFSTVYYGGSLAFNAGSVVIPNVPPQTGSQDYADIVNALTPFSFTGTLSGFASPSLTGTPLFTLQLAGRGLGDAGFANLGSGVFLDYSDYHFKDAAAPAPEPGSLLLLGSGIAWITARCRKRRVGVARND